MQHKEQICQSVAAHSAEIIGLNDEIWDYSEIGFHVECSADALQKKAEDAGFIVQRGLAQIPDALVAEYGSGRPVIGILAEYDALSGLSQERGCPTHNPRAQGAPGHGCGHCSLAAGAFGAAVAVKDFLSSAQIPGTVKLYGCPAEENGWAKTFMARDGYFNDLDAALTWHPQTHNFVVERSSLAVISLRLRFTGVPAHAAGDPEKGRSALDACELMNVGVNYLREHVISDARIHYAYLDAGGTAPNVVQSQAALHYFVRAPLSTQALEIAERVKDVAKGAAIMTGTKVQIEVLSGMSNLVMNDTLNQLLYEAFLAVGGPKFDAQDKALAAKFYRELLPQQKATAEQEWKRRYGQTHSLHDAPLFEDINVYRTPETILVDPGSTDVGDVSYLTPTAQINVAAACAGTSLHSWNMTGQAATSIAHKAALKASEVLALAAATLFERPDLLQKAREELQSITGGEYPCPILKDTVPPID